MTKRERQFYHLGTVCGLVKGIAEQLIQNINHPAARRAMWHGRRMGETYSTGPQSEEEKSALIRGFNHGKKLQEKLFV